MMRVLITGTSTGIGRGTAIKFLDEGFEVIGFDIEKSTIDHAHYTHYIVDVGLEDKVELIQESTIDDAIVPGAKVSLSVKKEKINLFTASGERNLLQG